MKTLDEQMVHIRQQSRWATAALVMATIHIYPKNGDSFSVEAFPWDCLDVARSLTTLGDVDKMFITHSELDSSAAWWTWERPRTRRVKRAA